MMILISNNVKTQKIRPEALFGGAKYRNLIDKKPYKKANKQTIKLLLEKHPVIAFLLSCQSCITDVTIGTLRTYDGNGISNGKKQ